MGPDSKAYELLFLHPPSLSSVTAAKTATADPTFSPPKFGSHTSHTHDPFLNAAYIRKSVFVDEQKCDLDLEIDDEEVHCFHWLVIASTPSDQVSDAQSKDNGVAAATVRLVLARPHVHAAAPHGSSVEGAEQEKGERPLVTDPERPSEPDMEHSTIWDGHELYVKIGRLATLKEYRGHGYGKVLVDAAIGYAQKHPEQMLVKGVEGKWEGLVIAHAQREVLNFYEKCGFQEDNGMGRFWEEGIEHVGVWKRVQVG